MSRRYLDLSPSGELSPSRSLSPISPTQESDQLSDQLKSVNVNGESPSPTNYLRQERHIIIKEKPSKQPVNSQTRVRHRYERSERAATTRDGSVIDDSISRERRRYERNRTTIHREETTPKTTTVELRKTSAGQPSMDESFESNSTSRDLKHHEEQLAEQSHEETATQEQQHQAGVGRRRREYESDRSSQEQQHQAGVGRRRREYESDRSSQGSSVLQNARASLHVVEPPVRKYPLLSADVAKKYEHHLHLPGIKPIPGSTPDWKVPLLQRKNRQVIEEFLRAKEEEKKRREVEWLEEEKWKRVPEWMKPLMREKERGKKLEQVRVFEKMQQEKKDLDQFYSLPPWKQELLLKKKEKEKLDALPDWQKDLITKRKVAKNRKSFEGFA